MRISLLTLASILTLFGCEELASTPEPPQPVGGPECGNNFVNPAEQCDDGNDIEDDGCTTECRYTCQPWPGYRNPCVVDVDRLQSCLDHAACQRRVQEANAQRSFQRCAAGEGPWSVEQCQAGLVRDMANAATSFADADSLCRRPRC